LSYIDGSFHPSSTSKPKAEDALKGPAEFQKMNCRRCIENDTSG